MAASRAEEAPERQLTLRREKLNMDTSKTMDTHVISEAYFDSLLNPTTRSLHLVENKNASVEEIRIDTKAWYSGFQACAKLLGANPGNLPVIESVTALITKSFPEKTKTLAA